MVATPRLMQAARGLEGGRPAAGQLRPGAMNLRGAGPSRHRRAPPLLRWHLHIKEQA